MPRKQALEYPPGSPGLRERMERVQKDADKAIAKETEDFAPPGRRRTKSGLLVVATDRASALYVTRVFPEWVRLLCDAATQRPWRSIKLKFWTDYLLAQLIDATYIDRHLPRAGAHPRPLDQFEVMMRDQLRGRPWESLLETTLRKLIAAEARPSGDDGAALAARKKRREGLIQKHCNTHRLSREGFNQAVGKSDTAVRALVNDTPRRAGATAKGKLLRVLGISAEEWDRL